MQMKTLEPSPFFQKHIHEKSVLAKATTSVGIGPRVRGILYGSNSWKFADESLLRAVLEKRLE